MAEIDLEVIRFKRAEASKVAEEIRSQIQALEGRLIEQQARIGVYDELLASVSSAPVRTPSGLPSRPVQKERGPRTTKAEMARRKKAVAAIFAEHGDLQPKVLLPFVQETLGYPLEAHHLRAVLRRFSGTFSQRAEHGLWGLAPEAEPAYSPTGDETS